MSAYKHYVIQEGDTIQTIAFKLYQDMEQWHTLVNLNHLEYPYIVDTPQEKMGNPEHLLTRGDRMLLPNDQDTWQRASENKIIESNTAHYQPVYYDTVLGMDLALNVNTDGHMDEAFGILDSDGHQPNTVVGIQNLKQSLILRILTRKGTLLFHPEYGSLLPDMLGKQMNRQLLMDAKNELRRTLTSDPRVKNATVTSAKMSYTSMFLTADITPIGSDKIFNLYLYQSENGEISIR